MKLRVIQRKAGQPADDAARPARSYRRKGLSLVPSLFTAGNMGLGLFAILSVLNGKYYSAAMAILIAHVLDILDGRVARWAQSSSSFGVEFDSLADLISFGVAPAVMMYELVLKSHGKLGFAMALLYVICGALRLARFNVKAHNGETPTPYFVGLPTPAAGGILAVFVILSMIASGEKEARTIEIVMKQMPLLVTLIPIFMFVLSLLMVSNIRYSTLKHFNILRPQTLRVFIITVIVALMIYVYPENTIFILYTAYIVWGIGDFIWRKASKRVISQTEELPDLRRSRDE